MAFRLDDTDRKILTELQAFGLNGHFAVEQGGRVGERHVGLERRDRHVAVADRLVIRAVVRLQW